MFVFVVVVLSWGWSGRSSVLFFTLRRLSRRLGAGDDLDESAQARAILRHLGSHGVQGHLVAFKFEVDVEMSETSGVSSRGGVYASRVVGGDGCFHRGCALRARFDAKALESRAAGVVLGVRRRREGSRRCGVHGGGRDEDRRGGSPRARSRPQPARLPSGWGGVRHADGSWFSAEPAVTTRGLTRGRSTARDAPIARGGSNSLETRGGDEPGASCVSRREACPGVRQRRGRYDVSSFPRRREVELGQLGGFFLPTTVVQGWQARTLFVTSIPRGPALGGMSGTRFSGIGGRGGES